MAYPETSALGSLELGVRKVCFALHACCGFVAPPGDASVDDVLHLLHPPAHLRMLAMIEQAVAVLHDQGGADLRFACDAITLGASHAETAWSAAFGTPAIDVFALEYDALSQQLRALYAKNLPRLR